MSIVPNKTPELRKLITRARWDAETVFLIADLFHHGVPPSAADMARLDDARGRLANVVAVLSSSREATR